MPLLAVVMLVGCAESRRYEISYDDNIPPGPPEFVRFISLTGGARVYFKMPMGDEDLLSIDVEHTIPSGKTIRTQASYFTEFVDIYGFADTLWHDVSMYCTDRAGNRSQSITFQVKPKVSVLGLIEDNLLVKPGFGAFVVQWENLDMQRVLAYIDINYTLDGEAKTYNSSYSSSADTVRLTISGFDNFPDNTVYDLHLRFEDDYGNQTPDIVIDNVQLLEDDVLPKTKFRMLAAGDSLGYNETTGVFVKMVNGNEVEGNIDYLFDNKYNDVNNLNYIYTNVGAPWNIIVDLGANYRLSRIVTFQRRIKATWDEFSKGYLYADPNVGRYNMYYWDDVKANWTLIREVKIPIVTGLEMAVIRAGKEGDMQYMDPKEPGYTPATRYFRYEALGGFGSNYTSTEARAISEMALYGLPE
jgi:hypothetical protein